MSSTYINLPRLLTEAELCEYLKKSRAWAQRSRFEGTGPPFVKAGRTPLYPASEVEKWLRGTQRNSTCETCEGI